MKINYLFKNTGSFLLATGLLVTTLLSSCLKDNSPGNQLNFGNSPALISWQFAGFQEIPYTAAVLQGGDQVYDLEVALSASSVTLGSAVTAKVVLDPTALAAYNAANGTSLVAPPSDQYSFPTTVTIPAGSQLVKFPLTFNTDAIDFSQPYGFALTLTDASGATIPSNLNTAVVIVKLKSPYAGSYALSGARTRFNGGTEGSGVRDMFPISGNGNLSTYTTSIVTGTAGDSGSGYTWALQVNADNSVTVLPDPTAAAGGTPDSFNQGDGQGQSSYDPGTHTFTIHCGYLNSAGALREIDEVEVLNQ